MAQVYTSCTAVVLPTDRDRAYRVIFLGPLVHILVCLDVVRPNSLAFKNEIKLKLKQAKSEEIDNLRDVLTLSV